MNQLITRARDPLLSIRKGIMTLRHTPVDRRSIIRRSCPGVFWGKDPPVSASAEFRQDSREPITIRFAICLRIVR